MPICDYGCGEEAKHQLKNGKWCCGEKWQSCFKNRERVREQTIGERNPLFGKKHSLETKNKIRDKSLGKEPWNKGIPRRAEVKEVLSRKLKGREPWNKGKLAYSSRRKIDDINEKYPFFSMVEEMRCNPNNLNFQEIQVRCKNHKCRNSKEKDGWFTPTPRQLEWRISALHNKGVDLNYFYCSQECKDTCSLYNSHGFDPLKVQVESSYTSEEYQTFRQHVLTRDNNTCQFCGNEATDVHHERPQKLEPFFALDPDFAWSSCEGCHYSKGHSGECNRGNLAKKVCQQKKVA
jgi:5-methylcytosine-specific restriction endonuclease McrA